MHQIRKNNNYKAVYISKKNYDKLKSASDQTGASMKAIANLALERFLIFYNNLEIRSPNAGL